jgi:hypothetical protein
VVAAAHLGPLGDFRVKQTLPGWRQCPLIPRFTRENGKAVDVHPFSSHQARTRSFSQRSNTPLEYIMKKVLLAATTMSLGLLAATVSLPARADSHDLNFGFVIKMADANKDSMITKEEFLAAMGKAYDMKMAKMKAGKDANMMVKGNAMTMEGFKSLINDIHSGA